MPGPLPHTRAAWPMSVVVLEAERPSTLSTTKTNRGADRTCSPAAVVSLHRGPDQRIRFINMKK